MSPNLQQGRRRMVLAEGRCLVSLKNENFRKKGRIAARVSRVGERGGRRRKRTEVVNQSLYFCRGKGCKLDLECYKLN